MVNDRHSISTAAAQQLPPNDPLAAAIQAHKHANAAYRGASERLWHLIQAVDPDLEPSDLDEVRAKLGLHYGDAAPARIDELLTARDVSSALGDDEDAGWTRFADAPLKTAEQVEAYVAHVKAHARTQSGAEVVFLWCAMDRLAAMLGERIAA